MHKKMPDAYLSLLMLLWVLLGEYIMFCDLKLVSHVSPTLTMLGVFFFVCVVLSFMQRCFAKFGKKCP